MTNLTFILANWLRDKSGNDRFWGVTYEPMGAMHNGEPDKGAIMCYPTKVGKYIHSFLIYGNRVVQYLSYPYGAYTVIMASDPEFLEKLWRILEQIRGHMNHLYNDGRDQYLKGYKPMNFDYPTPEIEIRNHGTQDI